MNQSPSFAFPCSAVVRDLPPNEIKQRFLPYHYWCEFKEELIVHSEIAGIFSVPKGFLSDGASIPDFLWGFLDDVSPDILYPSYAHDLLYSVQGNLEGHQLGSDTFLILSRDQCDHVIKELMLAVGCPYWKAQAVYLGLKIGGQSAWNNHSGGNHPGRW